MPKTDENRPQLGFPNALQVVVMLISRTAWSGYMTRILVKGNFLGWFFGRKRLTYTRVNTVGQSLSQERWSPYKHTIRAQGKSASLVVTVLSVREVRAQKWSTFMIRQLEDSCSEINRRSVCSRTTVGQRLPSDWEEQVTTFRLFHEERMSLTFIGRSCFQHGWSANVLSCALLHNCWSNRSWEHYCVTYRSPENKLHCCIHVFRVRQKAETGGHLQTKNNAQRKPSSCYSCPLPKQRMDGWIEMEWLSRVRKYGVQDPCPSSIEPLCSSSIASVHTLMKEQF